MAASSVPRGLEGLRVALVHDYLNQSGGAENIVAVFADMFPDAPIYTSVYDATAMPDSWKNRDIRTSFMQRISPRMSIAKALFPLYPTAFESFDFREFDLVLSSTTTFAKGVLTRPDTCHICYCNNPTRFLWMYPEYVSDAGLPTGATHVLPWLSTPLRVWDYAAAQRVDYFVAGSYNAARRIAKYYRRESDVVQPCIDSNSFCVSPLIDDYFLVVSRLQSYKRIDLAVQACTRLGLPLHIVGDGPDRSRLQHMAGKSVRFFGRISDWAVRDQYSRCRAFLFPGEEDFGLTPLEAQASGRPVIAYRAGGALETVRENQTGVFFSSPTVDSLADALSTFDPLHFKSDVLQEHARTFDTSVFKQRMYDVLSRRFVEHNAKMNDAGH